MPRSPVAPTVRPTLPERPCEYCGAPFAPINPLQRLCGAACRWKKWNAAHPRVVPWVGKKRAK